MRFLFIKGILEESWLRPKFSRWLKLLCLRSWRQCIFIYLGHCYQRSAIKDLEYFHNISREQKLRWQFLIQIIANIFAFHFEWIQLSLVGFLIPQMVFPSPAHIDYLNQVLPLYMFYQIQFIHMQICMCSLHPGHFTQMVWFLKKVPFKNDLARTHDRNCILMVLTLACSAP